MGVGLDGFERIFLSLFFLSTYSDSCMGCIHNWIISEARRFRGVRIEEDEMSIDLEWMGDQASIRDQIAGTKLVYCLYRYHQFLKKVRESEKAKTGTPTFIFGRVPTVGKCIESERARDACFWSFCRRSPPRPSPQPAFPAPGRDTLPSTMDTFSDGPSHQNALDFPFHSSSSSNDMRQHLQNILDSKEKQLQQAAALGERLLAQRVELEERVRLLQDIDGDKSDEITADMRERYRELADAVRAWDIGNTQLTTVFTSSVCTLFFPPFFPLVGTLPPPVSPS